MERHHTHTLHSSRAQLPQSIIHPSHPDPGHSLILLTTPIYPNRLFTCNGCGQSGHGFSYHCTRCNFDLHILCASKPPGPLVLQPQIWSPMTNYYSFPGPNYHQYQATAPIFQSGFGLLKAMVQGFVTGAANLLGQDFVQGIMNYGISDPDSILDLLFGYGNVNS